MKHRHLAFISLGNVLEWFDFGLFIYLAPLLGKTFFNSDNELSAYIAALSVFATGYLCRPIGGILFGYFGDTRGRAGSLQKSIVLMSVATLLIGLLPSFATIGILSSVLFTFARILQGIAAGGEYTGILIYLAESSPISKRGFFTSLANSGANLGFFLASVTIILLHLLCPVHSLPVWGFRIPFIVLGLLGLLIFYSRLQLKETAAFNKARSLLHVTQNKPLFMALRFAPLSLLKIFAMTCMSSIYYIFYFGYLSQYLPSVTKITFMQTLIIQMILLFLMLFLVPMAGLLGDRIGRKNILLITCILMIVTTLPIFNVLLSDTILITIFIMLSFPMMLSAFDQGNNSSAFVENCPIDVRYSGVGFAYNVGNAIFGGTAPLIFSLLNDKFGHYAPAYYLIACGCVSLVAITTLFNKKETDSIGFYLSDT